MTTFFDTLHTTLTKQQSPALKYFVSSQQQRFLTEIEFMMERKEFDRELIHNFIKNWKENVKFDFSYEFLLNNFTIDDEHLQLSMIDPPTRPLNIARFGEILETFKDFIAYVPHTETVKGICFSFLFDSVFQHFKEYHSREGFCGSSGSEHYHTNTYWSFHQSIAFAKEQNCIFSPEFKEVIENRLFNYLVEVWFYDVDKNPSVLELGQATLSLFFDNFCSFKDIQQFNKILKQKSEYFGEDLFKLLRPIVEKQLLEKTLDNPIPSGTIKNHKI